MKPIKKEHIFAFVLLATLLALGSCSQDELAGSDSGNAAAAFTISVTDGGYVGLQTRAAESGYQTTFTAGDQIGVFAVKDGVIVGSVNNLCLTAEEESSALVWKDAGGSIPVIPAGANYYGYYPYQASLTGSLVLTATDAAEFFADVVSSWTPGTEQGTYADYTAQDLMTAKGTASGKNLFFSMQHQMALVVIDLPRTKYSLSTDINYTWIADALDLQFTGFAPCRMDDGTYRYLVKPATSPSLSGSYTNATPATAEWTFTANGIAAGNYKTFKVDDATVTVKSHTLAAGDFYMKDGSLVGKDETLTDAQKATCLGIVMKVGRDDSGDWNDDCSYTDKNGQSMTTLHGYVLALYDANGGSYCTWGSYGSGTGVGTNTSQYTLFCGYSNTQTIKSYASSNSLTLSSAFPATYYATEDYETGESGKYAAPSNSSGWFLPSAGQCWYWYQNRTILQTSMAKAKGSNSWASWYWSSSEYSGDPAIIAWCLHFDGGDVHANHKVYSRYVRSCLAF